MSAVFDRVSLDAATSSGKSPIDHAGKLISPEIRAMVSVTLNEDNFPTRALERACPSRCVVQEEGLLGPRDQVSPRNWTGDRRWRLITGAWRAREDRAVNVGVSKSQSDCELPAGRNAKYSCTHSGQIDVEGFAHPPGHLRPARREIYRHLPAAVIWERVDDNPASWGAHETIQSTPMRDRRNATDDQLGSY
jgi:hypothetical protein